ncbi:MAG: hypothetical protein KKE20_00715 [Nanoarchaeota archaeon]|nr:hypothetical protein [Nanoarchaeota archaeon]
MKDNLEKAQEELKRVDHLIYVSLKYTRTCDIFKSILERMIASVEFMLNSLLKKMEAEGKIDSLPEQPIAKSNKVKENYQDDKIKEIADFYILLRKINRAPFDRAKEFRRHVTMTVQVGEEKMEINIDNITDYYKRIKEYYDHVNKVIKGEI